MAKQIKKRYPAFSILKVLDAGTRWDYEYAASPEETEDGPLKAFVDAIQRKNICYGSQLAKEAVDHYEELVRAALEQGTFRKGNFFTRLISLWELTLRQGNRPFYTGWTVRLKEHISSLLADVEYEKLNLQVIYQIWTRKNVKI